MITWNIDPTNYNEEQLELLLEVVQYLDYSIAKEIQNYLIKTYNT
jgi:hypothetical protein